MNVAQDSFVHLDPTNPFSSSRMDENAAYVDLWMGYEPPPERPMREVVAQVAAWRGESTAEVKKHLRVGAMLRRMPKLAESANRLRHLCARRLQAIERQVCAVTDPGVLAELDQRITDYLEPAAPNEALVQAPTITKNIRAMVIEVDEAAATKPADLRQRSGSIRRGAEGFTRISFNLPDDEGLEVRKYFEKLIHRLRAKRRQAGEITLADALLDTVRENTQVTVLHNLIERDNVTHLNGAGPLTSEQAARWQYGAAPRVLSLHASAPGYEIPEAIRTTVELLDGHCRFPGCDVEADLCEKDHCEEFSQGGETSVDNLFCLCKFHHTMKTERQVFYRDLGDRELEWHFRNGHTMVTRPHGPAASRRFSGRSLADAEAARVRRRRA